MLLKITEQPQQSFAFCCKSQAKASKIQLYGRKTTGYKRKTYPTLELHVCNDLQPEQYFIRCSLHQALNDDAGTSCISPHILHCRQRGDLKEYNGNRSVTLSTETELFPCQQVTPHIYKYTLEKSCIINSARKDWMRVLMYKIRAQRRHNMLLAGNNSGSVELDPEQERDIERIAHEQVNKPQYKVRLCFEVFKRTHYGFVLITAPMYSECIRNGAPPHIEILKTSGAINEINIINLKVDLAKPKDKIIIYDTNDDKSLTSWQKEITLDEDMIYQQTAITLQMPIYRGVKRFTGQKVFKCKVQMERLSDGARSNEVNFFYVNNLKRSVSTMTDLKEHDMVVTKRTCILENESLEIFQGIREQLRCLLDKLRIMIKEIKNVSNDCDKKSLLIKKVRQYFKSYVRAHPDGNSFLHDILANSDLQAHDKELHEIIALFELEDLASQVRNNYGATTLMYASMYNQPYFVGALINMSTSFTAQDVETGNNVLHIIIEQAQKLKECSERIMRAMSMHQHIESFARALKMHNLRGLTPLHLAVIRNNVQLVAELLQFCMRNAELDVLACGQQSDGNTILHLSVLNRNAELHACILKHTGDSLVNVMNYAGHTAMDIENRSYC